MISEMNSIFLFLLITFFPHSSSSSSPRLPRSSSITSSKSNLTSSAGQGPSKLKILVFSPQIGYSHLQFAAAIADTLAGAGHEVHVLEVLFNSQWRNFTDFRHQHRIIRVMPTDPGDISWNVSKLQMLTRAFEGQFNAILDGIWSDWSEYWPLYCKFYLKQDAVLAELARQHYDVAITELYHFCPLGIFHRVGIPVTVATSACPISQSLGSHFGIPTIPSLMTSLMAPVRNGPYLTFSERVFNLFSRFYEKMFLSQKPYDKELLFREKFGPDFPSLAKLVRNVSFLFVNTFDHYDLPRPSVRQIVNIGGIVEDNWPVSRIDRNSERILQAGGKGVVFLSMGSSIDPNQLSPELRRAFAYTFAQFPDYEFIWKMDTKKVRGEMLEALDSIPNLHLLGWVNQRAVLAHPRLRAFITHCGRNSLNEAAMAGVPVVALPLFADQPYNAMTARYKGVAEVVDIDQLPANPNLLAEALEKMKIYRLAALDLKRRIELSPFPAAQKLIRNIEFAAEFGGGVLADMNLPTEEELGGYLVYHSLDVLLISIGFLLAALVATILPFFFLVKWTVEKIPNFWTKKSQKEKSL